MILVNDPEEFHKTQKILEENNCRVTWQRSHGLIEILLEPWDYKNNKRLKGLRVKKSEITFHQRDLEEKLSPALAEVRVKIANYLINNNLKKKR